MSAQTLLWVKAVHIFGMIMWVGTLMGLYQVLFAHTKASGTARDNFVGLGREIAMAMDVGALLAMGAGVAMLLGIEPSPLKSPWMHIKLTLVLVFLGIHGYGRVTLGKLRKGVDRKAPPAIFPVITLVVIAIVIMAVVKPIK